MELRSHDILIVGGGGAGLRAAIAIGEANPTLSVGLVSKVYPMRSHTVSAEGGAAAAIKPRTGVVRAIAGKAVILCTGGAGRMFPFTTNAAIKTGDGMALAYRAGVPLKDMEFVQYHPTGLPGTGILITEAARGEGGILVNKDGYRYLHDYDLGQPLDVNDPNHPKT